MSAGAIVLSALKVVGGWVAANSGLVRDAVDGVVQIAENKKTTNLDERLQAAEEKVNQLGAAALEIDQKIDSELEALRKQMRTVRIAMIAMGAALCATIIAVILLFVF